MKRIEHAAVLSDLVCRLRAAESWAGETHIQKAVFLLQELFRVPTDYQFVFYKHGPYSFDLSDDLAAFRADGLLEWQIQAPYGPRYAVTALGERTRAQCAGTLAAHQRALEAAAGAIGARNVGGVERLATALYVTKRQCDKHDGSPQGRAVHLHRLKPHVPLDQAMTAVQEIDALLRQFTSANK